MTTRTCLPPQLIRITHALCLACLIYLPLAAEDIDPVTAVAEQRSALSHVEAMLGSGASVTSWADTKHQIRDVDGQRIAFRLHRADDTTVTGLIERATDKGRTLTHWVDGRMQGPTAAWYADGSPKSEAWMNGGAWPLVELNYHPNGQLSRFFIATPEHNLVSQWDEAGQLTASHRTPAAGGSVANDEPAIDHRPAAWQR